MSSRRLARTLVVLATGSLLAGSMTVGLTGCKEEATWKSRLYVERTLTTTLGEVRIPAELWAKVITPEKPLELPSATDKHAEHADHAAAETHDSGEKHASTEKHEAPSGAGGEHGESESHDASAIGKALIETDLKPITVYMIEETPGVLGGRNQKINFGPGGGDIDLRDFVSEKRGAFRIVFEFGSDDPAIVKRVWYVSNAQRRKVGPDWVGAGCDRYMDISTFVKKETAKDGMLIAVGGDRHVSALAGTFLFSLKRGSRIEVARLTFTDSGKRKDILCRGRRDS